MNVMQAAPREHIGRFEVKGVLGSGAQSVVYLCHDPDLDRQVAIKALPAARDESQLQEIKTLLKEARTLARLQHPNTVSIFEVGQVEGSVYLVLEYVRGRLLTEYIQPGKPVSLQLAVDFIRQLLDGLSYVHQCGVIHGDIKPGNIIVDDRNVPKIMDFGISGLDNISGDASKINLSGTPSYMAPEYISTGKRSRSADIYALGVVFYMMVTGEKPVTGKNIRQIFLNALDQEVLPPSTHNPLIDPVLDNVIMTALAKTTQDRYQDASSMQHDLARYRINAASQERSGQDTTNEVLRKIRTQRDFPALSKQFLDLGSLFGSDPDIEEVARVISRDLALANKLLKVVNSAFYSNAGGAIETISHAVVMLGFKAVREIASSLTIIDHVGKGQSADLVRAHTINSLYAALIAQRLAAIIGYEDLEEIFLCAMFHDLGWLLTAFYLPAECIRIRDMVAQGADEEQAAEHVLNIDLTTLGQEIARDWCLPEQIIHSMNKPACLGDSEPAGQIEQLQVISTLANQLAKTVAAAEPYNCYGNIRTLRENWGASVAFSADDLGQVLINAREEFLEFASIAKINPGECELARHLSQWDNGIFLGSDKDRDPTTQINQVSAKPAPVREASLQETTIKALPKLISSTHRIGHQMQNGAEPKKVLGQLIRALCNDGGFDRALLTTLWRKQGLLRTVGGWGTSRREEFLDQFRSAPISGKDLFGKTLLSGEVQQIHFQLDTVESEFARLPVWYRPKNRAREICILPIVWDSKTRAALIMERQQPLDYGEADIRAMKYLAQISAKALQLLLRPSQK